MNHRGVEPTYYRVLCYPKVSSPLSPRKPSHSHSYHRKFSVRSTEMVTAPDIQTPDLVPPPCRVSILDQSHISVHNPISPYVYLHSHLNNHPLFSIRRSARAAAVRCPTTQAQHRRDAFSYTAVTARLCAALPRTRIFLCPICLRLHSTRLLLAALGTIIRLRRGLLIQVTADAPSMRLVSAGMVATRIRIVSSAIHDVSYRVMRLSERHRVRRLPLAQVAVYVSAHVRMCRRSALCRKVVGIDPRRRFGGESGLRPSPSASRAPGFCERSMCLRMASTRPAP